MAETFVDVIVKLRQRVFLSVLLLCSFFRQKELFKVKNDVITSLLFLKKCHLEIIVTPRSLNVIHLPTRLPWENSFAVPQPSLPHVLHVKLPVKGVLNTLAWYVSYARLMKPSDSETAAYGC